MQSSLSGGFSGFNPRSHEGNDMTISAIFSADIEVSIHVPTRGTTQQRLRRATTPEFQSTFPRGERRYTEDNATSIAGFQSTFPRGERRTLIKNTLSSVSRFNPRSHEGNDVIQEEFCQLTCVSIHVPTRGTT